MQCNVMGLVLIAYAQVPPTNAHYDLSSGVKGLNIGQMHLYIHTMCMQAASLRICADSPESSLLDNAISTKIIRACSFLLFYKMISLISGPKITMPL